MAEVSYRHAVLDEAVDILAVVKELAGEIPILLDTLEREEALYRTIRNCARSGESWVAVDESARIVGFLLVEQNQTGRFWGEHEILDLRHGGVVETHRRQGIFTELLRRVVDRLVPLNATVNDANRSGVARYLEAIGFHQVASPGGERRFRREPG